MDVCENVMSPPGSVPSKRVSHRHKSIHAVHFHMTEVLEQEKLMQRDRDHTPGAPGWGMRIDWEAAGGMFRL